MVTDYFASRGGWGAGEDTGTLQTLQTRGGGEGFTSNKLKVISNKFDLYFRAKDSTNELDLIFYRSIERRAFVGIRA